MRMGTRWIVETGKKQQLRFNQAGASLAAQVVSAPKRTRCLTNWIGPYGKRVLRWRYTLSWCSTIWDCRNHRWSETDWSDLIRSRITSKRKLTWDRLSWYNLTCHHNQTQAVLKIDWAGPIWPDIANNCKLFWSRLNWSNLIKHHKQSQTDLKPIGLV